MESKVDWLSELTEQSSQCKEVIAQLCEFFNRAHTTTGEFLNTRWELLQIITMMLYQGYATLSTTRSSRNKLHGHVHVSNTSQSNSPRYTPRCDYLSDRWDHPTFAYTPKEPSKPKVLEPVEPTWNYPVLMETSFLNNVPEDVTDSETVYMQSPPPSPTEIKFLYDLPKSNASDFDFLTELPPSPTPSRSKYIITPPASPLPAKKYIITPPGSPQQKPKQDDFSFLTLPRKPAKDTVPELQQTKKQDDFSFLTLPRKPGKEQSHRFRSSTVSYFHEVKHYIKNIKKFKRKPKCKHFCCTLECMYTCTWRFR